MSSSSTALLSRYVDEAILPATKSLGTMIYSYFFSQEKQKLTSEAEICRRKMSAASTLINGLSGEKLRWTMQSKAFKEQLTRLVGDVLLSTAFLSYSGKTFWIDM